MSPSTADEVGGVSSSLQRCPSCGGRPSRGGTPVPYDQVWRELEAEHQVRLPDDLRVRYTPAGGARLTACVSCGLQFFAGAIPGGPDFYQFLDRGPGYYNSLTWEGRQVLGRVTERERVVDFGCGDGTILRALPPSTRRRVGVDHNGAAIDRLRGHGIEGFTDDFEVFADRESGQFDVALAMQVVEHLPELGALMRAAGRALVPDGRLLIAVPNAQRETERFEPLDFPPHHLTRWTEEDLRSLARRYGFEVTWLALEPDARGAVRRLFKRRLPGSAGVFVARVAGRLTPARLAAALAHRLNANALGHTLLVELRLRTTDRDL